MLVSYVFQHYQVRSALGTGGLIGVYDPRYPGNNPIATFKSCLDAERFVEAYRSGQTWAVELALNSRKESQCQTNTHSDE